MEYDAVVTLSRTNRTTTYCNCHRYLLYWLEIQIHVAKKLSPYTAYKFYNKYHTFPSSEQLAIKSPFRSILI